MSHVHYFVFDKAMGLTSSVPKEIIDASVKRRHEAVQNAVQCALKQRRNPPRIPEGTPLKTVAFELSYLHEDFVHVDIAMIAEWEAERTRLALLHAPKVKCELSTDRNFNLSLRYTLEDTSEVHVYAFRRDSEELKTSARGLLETEM